MQNPVGTTKHLKKYFSNVILLHGYAGNEEAHWQTWLNRECRRLNLNVTYPTFPAPLYPVLKEWLTFLTERIPVIDQDTAFVCHSLGCATALQFLLLRDLSLPLLGKLILVAPTNPIGLSNMGLQELNHFYQNLELKKVKLKVREIEIFRSDFDPYVEEAEAKRWEEELGVKAHLIQGGEHLNVKSGHGAFPEILNSLIIQNASSEIND